ncbi:hypothetical protein LTR53_004811 [Teratosphaeriaceae sp. CCFEE 6253]|nr:hypothetical protein LTR53_004811 [Teratosphaeriaceae sp. CCFEE 6253]
MSDAASAQATLRAITYRLTSTPSKQLPGVAAQLASSIWTCKHLISTPPVASKQGSEASITVNRFRTYLSTLLQDRTVEGRWAAVVLVKAVIEAGGVEILSKSNGWVRSLLGILKKPDPPTTRTLAVLTLTRIFTLTWDHTNLVREITTPALPAFITTCLSNVEHARRSGNELHTVLDAFATLVPRHPTMFRTHGTQLRAFLLRTLSMTSEMATPGRCYTAGHRGSAQRLLILLHHCAPKQGAADKWDEQLKGTLTAAHSTCDRVFRSIIEDWQSTSGVQPSVVSHILLQGDTASEGEDAVGMAPWKGVFAGAERLVSLLELLGTQMVTMTAGNVTVRLGLMMDLITRITNLRIPAKDNAVQANPQVSKDEREALFALLPSLQAAALKLARSILHRFGGAVSSIGERLLEQLTWLFRLGCAYAEVRTTAYGLLADLLELQGPSLSRDDVARVGPIIKACCHDLLPTQHSNAKDGNSLAQSDQDSVANNTKIIASTAWHAAAQSLLPPCFSKLNAAYMPERLRTLMERTAILTQHKDALVACVLNPASSASGPTTQASLLPLLAKQYADCPEVEALLRPRMPVIRTGRRAAGDEEARDGEDASSSPAADGHVDLYGDVGNGADEEDEPATGLLHALREQKRAADEEEDLYAVSPKRPSQAGRSGTGPEKRKTIDGTRQDEQSAKRVRPSPSAETPPSSATGTVPKPASLFVRSSAPNPAVQDQPQSSFVTAPEPSQQPAAATGFNAGDVVDGGSDGSDFEMPPLTMEQDTEDESEDDVYPTRAKKSHTGRMCRAMPKSSFASQQIKL